MASGRSKHVEVAVELCWGPQLPLHRHRCPKMLQEDTMQKGVKTAFRSLELFAAFGS